MGTPPADPDTVTGLQHRLVELRAAIDTAQRRAAERPVVERALTLVERDRSVLSTPVADQLRAAAQADLDTLVDVWDDIDRLRHHLHRVRTQVAHLIPAGPDVAAPFHAEADHRAGFADRAAAVGLDLAAPTPTDDGTPDPVGGDDGPR